MPNPPSDRLNQLLAIMDRQPRDPLLLYGIAMEYRKLKAFDRAIEYFNKVIEVDPGYCYAYFHRGQTQELMTDPEAAKSSYRAGIVAAQRVGDAHAREELQAALDLLG